MSYVLGWQTAGGRGRNCFTDGESGGNCIICIVGGGEGWGNSSTIVERVKEMYLGWEGAGWANSSGGKISGKLC